MKDVAREKGTTYEPDREDNRHRLNMAVFPAGAEIIPNPYNKIAGFAIRSGEGGVFFVPGFPVMAWPMIEWVLDTHFAHLQSRRSTQERSVIVFGAMEAALTPLMEAIEREFAGIKVFSLPSVDHPDWGRHIELGVKGDPALLAAAVRAAARRPRARRRASSAPNWCARRPSAPYRCVDAHLNGGLAPGSTGMLSAKFRARFWGLRARVTPIRHPPHRLQAAWEID